MMSSMKQEITGLRVQLINYLSSAVGGDALAAEYLLLHLLSKMYIATLLFM